MVTNQGTVEVFSEKLCSCNSFKPESLYFIDKIETQKENEIVYQRDLGTNSDSTQY